MVFTVATKISIVGATLAIIGGLFGFVAVPIIVRNKIEQFTKLSEGNELYEKWEGMSLPIVTKYYFLNVSNPEEVQNGAKPIVKEIGPYVYKMKKGITRKGDVISYHQCQRFEFDVRASAPLTETDELTILNLPLMAMVTMAENNVGTYPYLMRILNYVIPTIFNNPNTIFSKITPKEFLFDGMYLNCNASGLIDSIVCNIIEYRAPAMLLRLEDGRFRFSINGHKNNTCLEYYSIDSGITDSYKVGEVISWQNHSTLNIWGENGNCNKISGSDGGLFPPFRTKQSVLNHFNTDVCRTVSVTYSESISFPGIEAYRYNVDETLFASPSNYSENQCYCLDNVKGIKGKDGCLLDGVIEISTCQGIPLIISLPHFYLANDVYKNGIEGLEPDQSLHQIFIDLEPMTGTIMRAHKRGQANIFLRPIRGIDLTTKLPTTLMPAFWIDEGYDLPDYFVKRIATELFDVLNIISIVKWSTVICGIMLLISGLIWTVRSMWSPQGFTKII